MEEVPQNFFIKEKKFQRHFPHHFSPIFNNVNKLGAYMSVFLEPDLSDEFFAECQQGL